MPYLSSHTEESQSQLLQQYPKETWQYKGQEKKISVISTS